MKGRCSMMKEKGQFKKKFVKKIATIMMVAAMVVSGGFGVAPAADHSVSVYATDNAYRGYHVTSTKTKKKPATSSTKEKQFGFTSVMENGLRVSFPGDEPYRESLYDFVKDSDWLLHEAFCVYGERDIFKPYEKHHSTVKDACELAEHLKIPNLVLWHTEDKNMLHRQEKYMKEGKQYYTGTLYIPEDLDVLKL